MKVMNLWIVSIVVIYKYYNILTVFYNCCSLHPEMCDETCSKWCDGVEDFFICVNLSIPKIQKYITTVQYYP